MAASQSFRYTYILRGKKVMIQPGRGSSWVLSTRKSDLGTFAEAFMAAAKAGNVAVAKLGATPDEATRMGELANWVKSPFMSMTMRPGR